MQAKMPVFSFCRGYASRLFLLLVLMAFVACDDDGGCTMGSDPCGEGVMIRRGFSDPVILTEANPTVRIITDDACAVGGSGEFYVYYQYRDIPTTPGTTTYTENPATNSKGSTISPDVKQATEKDKPLVTVKFGTVEKGVQNGAIDKKPGFINGWWAVNGSGSPPKVKEGTTPAPIHYVLSVTMQRPLIKLPGKAPSIVLPFIGPIIGPHPRDVEVRIILEYQQPAAAK